MEVRINNLPSDLLSYLFSFLSNQQLFIIEIVCKKWQFCVRKTLERVTTFDCRDYGYAFRVNHVNRDEFEFYPKFLIDDNNLNILKSVLSRCNKIKEFDLSETYLIGINALMSIAKLCPKLKYINWHSLDWLDPKMSKIDVTSEQFNEFALAVGPHILRCYFTKSKTYKTLRTIYQHFKNIEEADINFYDKELFVYLN